MKRSAGFTLLELLLVLALVGVLAAAATWGGRQLARGWQLRRAGHQLLEDLKALQGRAELAGGLALAEGALVERRSFLVFDAGTGRYAAFDWRDGDGDGIAEAGEATRLWARQLPPGTDFGPSGGIDRRACSNAAGPPPAAITFSSPAYPPCDDRPCLKFDRHGFSVMGPGAIYLNDGEGSLAITGTRPGHFTLCAWDGARWR